MLNYKTKIDLRDVKLLNEKQRLLMKQFFKDFINQNNYKIKTYVTFEDMYLFFENMDLKNIDEIWDILLIPESQKYKKDKRLELKD